MQGLTKRAHPSGLGEGDSRVIGGSAVRSDDTSGLARARRASQSLVDVTEDSVRGGSK